MTKIHSLMVVFGVLIAGGIGAGGSYAYLKQHIASCGASITVPTENNSANDFFKGDPLPMTGGRRY